MNPAGSHPATETVGEEFCVIPRSAYEQVEMGLGKFFEPITGIKAEVSAIDILDASKAPRRYAILSRYIDPRGKQVLEVGSGYGTNLIVWSKKFGLDMTGIEPEGEGFESTIEVSRNLCQLNGVDPQRINTYQGENLPFPDESFDIVYSANVLEHTQQPDRVLEEAIRILRPGGLLHFELPNYLSYFEATTS